MIALKDGARQNLIYVPDRAKLPARPGVYVFGRRRRNGDFEALYVGKANNIQSRVWGHRKNLPLMMHLRNARQGEKVVRAGVYQARPGQSAERALPLIERALIRYFLSEGHDLANQQGTLLRRHEIESDGPNIFIPNLMYMDRGKGE